MIQSKGVSFPHIPLNVEYIFLDISGQTIEIKIYDIFIIRFYSCIKVGDIFHTCANVEINTFCSFTFLLEQ